jgi:predicted phosphodiesterase
MADLTPFLHVQRDLEEASRPRPSHPKGWEPGIDTAKGTLTVRAGENPPTDWAGIITELGLDASKWTVDESQPVQVRSWDSGDKRMFYYRATVVPNGPVSAPDIDALVASIKRQGKSAHRGSQRVSRASSSGPERALVVCLADWQAGKPEFGGPEALVERLFRLKDAVPARLAELKRQGRPVTMLYVVGMGDQVESCAGHFAQQTYAAGLSGLDRRGQVKLVRRMLVELLTHWAGKVPTMVVGAVPGNHGEHRNGSGKSFTTFEDNDDLAVYEQAGEILAANPEAFGHVKFVLADGDMSLTLDVAGTVVTFAHGHQFRGSGPPQKKAESWWKGKQAARHRSGDADVLVWGHYHHLVCVEDGPRTFLQCPALDGGSRWFEEGGGSRTRTGTLTFTVDADGWDDLKVLR